MTETYTVLQLTTYIRDMFDLDPRLQEVWVTGEISNFTRAASGHLYFTLKDEKSELSCVMWKSQAEWLNFAPQHGDAVVAHGRVSVYEARGHYQLVCQTLQAVGAGDLNRQFEALKTKLDAEGLFDPVHRRKLPAFPRKIGVVTSPTTAAFQDILNVLQRRYPLAEVLLSATLVQGRDAPKQIVDALNRLNNYTDVDVIIMARGGGSLEDLWCFNDEDVVRAVARSRIPLVTGIGHEIDFTLVDFAADVRAPTPSAAAEIATPDGLALPLAIQALSGQLNATIQALGDDHRYRLDAQTRWLTQYSPVNQIQNARQRIDDLTGRMQLQIQHQIARRKDRLIAQTRTLEAAHPAALLQRGYAIITHAVDGQRVTSAHQVSVDMPVQITLHDGHLIAAVRERKLDD